MKAHLTIILSALLFYSCGAQIILSDKKFEAEAIKYVEVEGSFADVFLRDVDSKSVKFEGWIKGPRSYKGDVDIESRLEGSTLVIYIVRPNSLRGNFSGEFRIGIPKNMGVKVTNGSGNLYANGLQGQEIRLKCSSGNLEVSDVIGNLFLKTSSGNMRANYLEGNTSASTSSGNLRVENLKGNLDCRSSSGRIYLTNIKNTNLSAESSSGGVSLMNVRGKVDVESTSGSIRGERVELEADSFFETSSGSINVELENDVGEMSFDLKSTSGGLRVNGNRSEDRLIIKRGGIQLHGRSSSGSQYYFN